MKLFLATTFLIIVSYSNIGYASYPVNCQMEALKVATDNYDSNWSIYTEISSIHNIKFESPQEGLLVVTFYGKTCSLDVEVNYPTDPVLGCPEYTFSKLTNNCK